MEKQLIESEVDNRSDSSRLSTAGLVISAERRTAIFDAPAQSAPDDEAPLFGGDEAQTFRSRWEKTQIGFVDEPRKSVEQADELVAAVIKRLEEVFADERNKLEHEWDKGENVSTEDLRVALRRYRSFFDRLLSV
jgi:hypothetical protein